VPILLRLARPWKASKGKVLDLDIGRMREKSSSQAKTRERARRLLNQGAVLLEQGRAEEAIAPLERAYRIDAGNVPTLINLGGAYIMAGRHREAIPVLEAARNAEPDNAMIWINLGAAYLGNPVLASPEQQMQAIVAFEKALELNPAAPNVHYNLGLVFVDRKENDLAVAAFRQALRVNPFDRDAHQWLRKLGAEEEQPKGGAG
jgi:tetratricopeptide (TPR) repeat protein